MSRNAKVARAKPAGKTRLARYGIDKFLLGVAAQLKPRRLLLDGGAGNCKHRSFFPHLRTISLDLEPKRRRRYGQIDAAGDLNFIPFKEGTFDAVINIEVLEHVPEPANVLAEIFRGLRPGGQLFLTTPQGWEEHRAPHDYLRFTRYGLRYLFEKTGYRVITIEPLGGYFRYLGQRITVAYRYFFPDDRQFLWKILDFPIRLPARFFLRTFVPYMCFYLDRLDKTRTFTLSYGCVCEKP